MATKNQGLTSNFISMHDKVVLELNNKEYKLYSWYIARGRKDGWSAYSNEAIINQLGWSASKIKSTKQSLVQKGYLKSSSNGSPSVWSVKKKYKGFFLLPMATILRLDDAALRLYSFYLSKADRRAGMSYYMNETIAKALGIGLRQLKSAKKVLVDKGYIESVKQIVNGRVLYSIAFIDYPDANEVMEKVEGLKNGSWKGMKNGSRKGLKNG